MVLFDILTFMKKIGLLILHIFITFTLSMIFGGVFWLTGPYGLLYSYGDAVLTLAGVVLIFLATLLSSKFLSKIMIFAKNEVQFVLLISFLIWLSSLLSSDGSVSQGKSTLGVVQHSLFIVTYLMTTSFFLKSKQGAPSMGQKKF